jgi:hypothetical protein
VGCGGKVNSFGEQILNVGGARYRVVGRSGAASKQVSANSLFELRP